MTLPATTPLLPAPTTPPAIYDAYREPITNSAITDVDSAVRAFFQNTPSWLEKLMALRNAIVGRLGFETGDKERRELPGRFKAGDSMGAFGVLERSDDEIIMGGDDTHFSFRLSIWLPAGTNTVQATTHGHHHTALGRAYLAVVAPGHRLISPMMVRRMAAGTG